MRQARNDPSEIWIVGRRHRQVTTWAASSPTANGSRIWAAAPSSATATPKKCTGNDKKKKNRKRIVDETEMRWLTIAVCIRATWCRSCASRCSSSSTRTTVGCSRAFRSCSASRWSCSCRRRTFQRSTKVGHRPSRFVSRLTVDGLDDGSRPCFQDAPTAWRVLMASRGVDGCLVAPCARSASQGRPADAVPAQSADGRVRPGQDRRHPLPPVGDGPGLRRPFSGRGQPPAHARQRTRWVRLLFLSLWRRLLAYRCLLIIDSNNDRANASSIVGDLFSIFPRHSQIISLFCVALICIQWKMFSLFFVQIRSLLPIIWFSQPWICIWRASERSKPVEALDFVRPISTLANPKHCNFLIGLWSRPMEETLKFLDSNGYDSIEIGFRDWTNPSLWRPAESPDWLATTADGIQFRL